MQTGSKILKAGTVSLQHHLPLACLDAFRLWVPAPLSATTCLLARVLVLTVTQKLPCTAVLSWQDMPWLTHPWCLLDPEGHRGPHMTHRERRDLSGALLSQQLPTPGNVSQRNSNCSFSGLRLLRGMDMEVQVTQDFRGFL